MHAYECCCCRQYLAKCAFRSDPHMSLLMIFSLFVFASMAWIDTVPSGHYMNAFFLFRLALAFRYSIGNDVCHYITRFAPFTAPHRISFEK